MPVNDVIHPIYIGVHGVQQFRLLWYADNLNWLLFNGFVQ